MRPQKYGSLFVIHELLLMLTTIEFDHYFLLNAGKISNVLPNGMLTAKTMAAHLLASYRLPEQAFDIGHISP